MEEITKSLQSSLSLLKWRLRPSSRRRLETDVLALCSRMRPVIMVDYGGKMPELKDQLCALLKLCQKESSIFKHLRVMVIDDMIYLIHVEELAELVNLSLNSELEQNFVEIAFDPPKMITKTETSSLWDQLTAVQELFALAFLGDAADHEVFKRRTSDSVANAEYTAREINKSMCAEFIDLSSCLQDTLVTVPTLNGWLLGYPVVYLFGKEHISDAIYNLSTKSLLLYRILVLRNGGTSRKSSRQEELMSFSVPYDLSVEGSNEPWAEAFFTRMQVKLQKCGQIWESLKLEVSGCYPQAVVL